MEVNEGNRSSRWVTHKFITPSFHPSPPNFFLYLLLSSSYSFFFPLFTSISFIRVLYNYFFFQSMLYLNVNQSEPGIEMKRKRSHVFIKHYNYLCCNTHQLYHLLHLHLLILFFFFIFSPLSSFLFFSYSSFTTSPYWLNSSLNVKNSLLHPLFNWIRVSAISNQVALVWYTPFFLFLSLNFFLSVSSSISIFYATFFHSPMMKKMYPFFQSTSHDPTMNRQAIHWEWSLVFFLPANHTFQSCRNSFSIQ